MLLFRVWDVMIARGISAVHSMALGLLKFYESELISLPDCSDAFKFLADLPSRIKKDKIELDFDSFCIKEDVLNVARKKAANIFQTQGAFHKTEGMIIFISLPFN